MILNNLSIITFEVKKSIIYANCLLTHLENRSIVTALEALETTMELNIEKILQQTQQLMKRYQQLRQENAALKQRLATLESEHDHLKQKLDAKPTYMDLADQMIHHEEHHD